MATIRSIKRKKGVVYRAEVCIDGQRKSGTFDTRSEAHRWAEETEYLLRTGQPLPGELPDNDRYFSSAVEEYLTVLERKKQLSAATKYMYRHAAGRLLRGIKGKTIKTLTRRDINQYRDLRLEVVGPSSVRQDFAFLRGLYRHARLEWGLDVVCPTEDVSAPSPPRHREPMLSMAEIERLLDFCCISDSEKLYCYILLLLHTGMRPSEMAGLSWPQVRLAEHVILLSKTKTGTPRRVPLTDRARETLAQLEQGREAGHELVFLPQGRKVGQNPSGFFRKAFATACKRAGIKGITLYSLRHIAASYLVMLGVDIRTVADILGHTDIRMTMRYTHLLDAHKIQAISALDKIGR